MTSSSSLPRGEQLQQWVNEQTGQVCELKTASADASFRHYYRVDTNQGSRIVMDAPPPQEDCRPFVHVANLLMATGIHAPDVLAEDIERGFLLLSDLGHETYLQVLNEDNVERLYGDALGSLATMQACIDITSCELPPYDEALLSRELHLFSDWYLEQHCQKKLDDAQVAILESSFRFLIDNALEQPKVCVHRDYHSRNLMNSATQNPGILDFQDAVIGPVTYDLVSLLRDCYITWPQAQIEEWVMSYYELATQSGIIDCEHISEAQFIRWFDFMGVQRHLKAIGIFARLLHRDGKPAYVEDIPRTLNYVLTVCEQYQELEDFLLLLKTLNLADAARV